MHRISDDVRLALRGFRRTPAFFIAAVALIALGIGASSAIFSVATTVLIRELPMRDQNHLIALWANARGAATEVPTMADRYERFRRETKTLAAIAGIAHYGSNMAPLRAGSAALHARESLVTGNFFDVLGTRPVIGRLLRPEDDVKGAPDYDEERKEDQSHRNEVGDYFDRSRYAGMHGDPVGPQAGPGRTD